MLYFSSPPRCYTLDFRFSLFCKTNLKNVTHLTQSLALDNCLVKALTGNYCVFPLSNISFLISFPKL